MDEYFEEHGKNIKRLKFCNGRRQQYNSGYILNRCTELRVLEATDINNIPSDITVSKKLEILNIEEIKLHEIDECQTDLKQCMHLKKIIVRTLAYKISHSSTLKPILELSDGLIRIIKNYHSKFKPYLGWAANLETYNVNLILLGSLKPEDIQSIHFFKCGPIQDLEYFTNVKKLAVEDLRRKCFDLHTETPLLLMNELSFDLDDSFCGKCLCYMLKSFLNLKLLTLRPVS